MTKKKFGTCATTAAFVWLASSLMGMLLPEVSGFFPAVTHVKSLPTSTSRLYVLDTVPDALLLCDVPSHATALSAVTDSFQLLAEDVAKGGASGSGNKNAVVSLRAAGGATVLMCSMVALIYLWTRSMRSFRSRVPITLKPAMESVFSTVCGLGVIGAISGGILGLPGVEPALEPISKDWFGNKETLFNNISFFQDTYLQLGVIFFLSVVAMILVGLGKLDDIDEIQDAIVDQATGYRVTPEKLLPYYTEREFNRPQEQPGYTGIAREIFMPKKEWSAKILLLRNLVMDQVPSLPDNFRVEALIEESFAQSMYRAVQIPTLAWCFAIPILAFLNAVDLSHGVINASVIQAPKSAGHFIEENAVFTPAISAVIVSSIWSYWNCWKMTQIKYMILPKLEPDPLDGGFPVIRPPPIYNDYQCENFDSSPPTLRRVEQAWSKPPKTAFDDLFGAIGSAGLEFYGNSIKYQAWLNLAILISIGLQILPRDLEVLLAGAKAGNPSLVPVELFVYGVMTLVSLFELTVVTPRTFWNYCIISSMEAQNLRELLYACGYNPDYIPPGNNQGIQQARRVPALNPVQGPIQGTTGQTAAQSYYPNDMYRSVTPDRPLSRRTGPLKAYD